MRKPRAFAVAAAFGLLAAGLGGCGGFTPLYAAAGVTPKLSAIEVARPDGRTGYLIGQSLDDALARDRNQPPVYRLSFRTSELRVPRGINIANVASRYEENITASYILTEIATRKTVTSGTVHVNVTYDATAQPYAAMTAAQDGQRRAAEQTADRIRIELASFFASPRPNPTATVASPPDTNAYNDRQPGALMESPRERALGQPTPRGGQSDILGLPLTGTDTSSSTTGASGSAPQASSPSEAPDAIETLPDDSGSAGQ